MANLAIIALKASPRLFLHLPPALNVKLEINIRLLAPFSLLILGLRCCGIEKRLGESISMLLFFR